MLFYKGKFLFWDYPFSYLGEQYVLGSEIRNIPSTYLYSLDMFISGVVMLILVIRNNFSNTTRSTLYMMACLGFIIAAFSPNDTAHGFHVLGSTLVVSTLWFLTTIELIATRKKLGPLKHALLQLFLQIPIFTYAIAFFGDMDLLGSIMQKISLVSLCTVIIYLMTKLKLAKI